MRTACSVPTSSTLSSTMRTRARGAAAPAAGRRWHRGARHPKEPRRARRSSSLRVRAPVRLLHHLPDEEAHQARLARPQLLGLLRVGLDDAPAHGLDRARVAHLLHPELATTSRGRAVGPGDLRVDLLGLLAADGARRPPARAAPRPARGCTGIVARRGRASSRRAAPRSGRSSRPCTGSAVQRRRLLEERGDARVPRQHLRGVRASAPSRATKRSRFVARQLGQRRAAPRRRTPRRGRAAAGPGPGSSGSPAPPPCCAGCRSCPSSSFQPRVSCTMRPPPSSTACLPRDLVRRWPSRRSGTS